MFVCYVCLFSFSCPPHEYNLNLNCCWCYTVMSVALSLCWSFPGLSLFSACTALHCIWFFFGLFVCFCLNQRKKTYALSFHPTHMSNWSNDCCVVLCCCIALWCVQSREAKRPATNPKGRSLKSAVCPEHLHCPSLFNNNKTAILLWRALLPLLLLFSNPLIQKKEISITKWRKLFRVRRRSLVQCWRCVCYY